MERQIRLKDGGVARCNTETAFCVGDIGNGIVLYRTRGNRYFTYDKSADRRPIKVIDVDEARGYMSKYGLSDNNNCGSERKCLSVSTSVYESIRAVCIDNGITLTEGIENAILEYVDRHNDAK